MDLSSPTFNRISLAEASSWKRGARRENERPWNFEEAPRERRSTRRNSPERRSTGRTPSSGAAELFLQVAIIHLDQRGPSMRAGIWHRAPPQILQ